MLISVCDLKVLMTTTLSDSPPPVTLMQSHVSTSIHPMMCSSLVLMIAPSKYGTSKEPIRPEGT